MVVRRFQVPANIRTIAGILLVTAILVIADVAATTTALKFLLLPPFGALAYLVFINPPGIQLGVRHIVLCPTVTALWAWLIAGTLGYTALSVALVVPGTMAIMWLLRAPMIVPPMALALLTLLLHEEVRWHVGYLVSVAIFTVALYLIYLVWIRLPIDDTDAED